MLECWNSGGCAGLGNLYIFTVVVVMRYKKKNRDAIRVHFGFSSLLAIITLNPVASGTPKEGGGWGLEVGIYRYYRLSWSYYPLGAPVIPLDPPKSLLPMPSRTQASLSLLVSFFPPSIFPLSSDSF